jgi:hypothetical protein
VNCQSPVATRVGQLLRLAISTDKDGEALNALAAVRRTLAAVDLDLHAVEIGLQQAPPTAVDPAEPEQQKRDWRSEVKFCHRHRDQLAEHECGLVNTLMRWKGTPTPKQLDWLARIVQRIKAKG